MKTFIFFFALLAFSFSATQADLEIIRANIRAYYTAEGVNRSDALLAPSMTRLANRAKDVYSGGNTSGVSSPQMEPSGYWSDISNFNGGAALNGYTNLPTGSWEVRKHYERMLVLAQTLATPGATTPETFAQYKVALEKSLDFIHRFHKPTIITRTYLNAAPDRIITASPLQKENLWWWIIGVPYYNLGPILILSEGIIDSASWNRGRDMMTNFTFVHGNFDEGQNLAWSAIALVYRAVIERTATAANPVTSMDTARAYMQSVCQFTTGKDDGVRYDQSFFQHNEQLYNGGYGATFSESLSQYLTFTKSAPSVWKLGSAEQEFFLNYLDKGISFLIQDSYFNPAVVGREITRRYENARDGYYSLARAADADIPPTWKNLFLSRVKHIAQTFGSIGYDTDIEITGLISKAKESGVSALEPTGHVHYPASDFTMHRTANWSMGLKMYSKRVIPYERVNSEGKISWHLSDGVTWFMLSGSDYYSSQAFAAMDWNRLPGTTVENANLGEIINGDWGPKGSKDFVGGISSTETSMGVSAMDFQANNTEPVAGYSDNNRLSVKKSWFFFDDEVVCLGSGIGKSLTSSAPVETIVDQRPLSSANATITVFDGSSKSTAFANGTTHSPSARWIHGEEMGYYFPNTPTVKFIKQDKSGNWNRVNGSSSVPVTVPLLSLYLDHGSSPTGASYAYAVYPKKSEPQMESLSASTPITILRHDNTVHAVRDNSSGAEGYVFWNAGTFEDITVDKPCVLLVQKSGSLLTFRLSDPAQTPGPVTLTLAHGLTGIVAGSDVSASQSEETTTFIVSTSLGKTYKMSGYDNKAPVVTSSVSIATGSATVTLSVDENDGYYSVNNGPFIKFAKGSIALPAFTSPTTLSVYGKDRIQQSATITTSYMNDTTPPLVTAPTSMVFPDASSSVLFTTGEANGYLSVNGGTEQSFASTLSLPIGDTASVVSYGRDAYGNQSLPQTNHYVVHPGSFVQYDGTVSVEAEHPALLTSGTGAYLGKSWRVSADAGGGSSSSKYLEVADGGQSGNTPATPRADYEIDFIDSGDWYVWVRLKGPDASGDSIHLGLNGTALTGSTGLGGNTGWSWVNAVSGTPLKITIGTPGPHTLNLWMREDGVQVDKILLTRSASDIPTGAGPVETLRKNTGSDATPPVLSFSTNRTVFSQSLTLALQVDEGDGFFSWSEAGPFQRVENDVDGTAVTLSQNASLFYFTRDRLGNASPVVRRDYVRDDFSPELTISEPSKTFDIGVSVQLSLNEAGFVVVSEDGGLTARTNTAPFDYPVTRNVSLLVYGLDVAGNASAAQTRTYHTLQQSAYSAPYLPDAAGKFSIEAEHYASATRGGTLNRPEWNLNPAAGTSGLAIQAKPNLGDSCTSLSSLALSPRMDYPLLLGPGTYYIWVRLAGGSASDDSIHVGMNGGLINQVSGTSGMSASSGGSYSWKDQQSSARVSFTVPPGTAVGVSNLNIWMREDGVSVDKIYLTMDAGESAPVGLGLSESARDTSSSTSTIAGKKSSLPSSSIQDTRAPVLSGVLPSQEFSESLSLTLKVDEPSGYYQIGSKDWQRFDREEMILLNESTTLRVYALDAAGNSTATNEIVYKLKPANTAFGISKSLIRSGQGEAAQFSLDNPRGESLRATLSIYDANFRPIFRKETATTGAHLSWDLREMSGRAVSPGALIYQLDKISGTKTISRRGALIIVP